MSEQAQPVAVDQGSPTPQGIGADGRPVEKKVSFSADMPVSTARKLARFMAVNGETETANRISSTIGEGEVKVSWREKNPTLTGIAVGVVATVAVSAATIYGRRWYQNRKALTTASGGKVIRMAAR